MTKAPYKNNFTGGGYDPLQRPPPGHSLTLRRGNQPFEKPPKYTNLEKFMVEYIEPKFSTQSIKDSVIETLAAGTTPQALSKMIAFGAVSEGLANIDLIELARPQIEMQAIATALKFDPDMSINFGKKEEARNVSDVSEQLQAMKKFNPENYNRLISNISKNNAANTREKAKEIVNNLSKKSNNQNGFIAGRGKA
tara:strand:- start:297 stop:881 length:585 start_codon:yes stop_codon:yes gene_type:complete